MAYFECLLSQSSGGGGAVLTVTCDSALSGATISCTDGTTTLTAVCPSSNPYEVEFNIPNSGTWTISGLTYTASVVVELDYEVELGGFNYRAWLTAGGLDPSDYASLSAVLADEKAIRQLFLVHASVDYLASVTASDSSVETIIEDNYCAKWINESDYALFTLYDNSVIADLMDEADKYFYGEWGIVDSTTTPPTWGAKGNVPVMTSNTAPYGECSGTKANDTTNHPYWHAFNQNSANYYQMKSSSSGDVGSTIYKFTNPVNIRRLALKVESSSYAGKAFKVGYSDDGTNWSYITSESYLTTATMTDFDVDSNEYHLYWSVYFLGGYASSGFYYMNLSLLQFYGHTLKVSVPVMTSNTSPYGEVIKSSEYNSSYPAWRAFDQNVSTLWAEGTNDVNAWVGYKFSRKTILKKLRIKARWARIVAFSVQGSNDGVNFENIATPTIPSTDDLEAYFDIDTDSAYTSYRACVSKAGASSSTMDVKILQFYCLDYSEKEFEPNTTKKWLYDHGVELETFTKRHGSAGGEVTENDSYIFLKNGSASASGATGYQNYSEFFTPIDLTQYTLVRAKIGNIMDGGLAINVFSSDSARPNNGSYINTYDVAVAEILSASYPNNASLNINQVNGNNWVGVGCGWSANSKNTLTELWLE